MKEYIRTKDGRIAEIKEDMFVKQSDVLRLCYKDRPFVSVLQGDGDEVIKQADTIDELCDEYVLYDNQLNTYGVFVKKVIGYKWLQNHKEIYKGMAIYGAIWTNKGLIYVAKMNDKGELELI